jgi:membrane protein
MLTWVFRFVTPSGPRWTAATIGALTTASFLAGFLQGFALFLSLPIDVGIPYAGIDVVGGVVAVGLWLWVLHMVFLVGWSVTRSLDSRIGRPRTGSPTEAVMTPEGEKR